MGQPGGVQPCVALVVSGGHTLLIHCRDAGDYTVLGKTRDDAAGEAFDKIAKMLGLPYPGGPQIDRLAVGGNPAAFDFPRSMLHGGGFMFSFSGLKTAVLYTLEKIEPTTGPRLADLCASVQAAIVDVLVAKTLAAAEATGEKRIAVSGGVACNSALRSAFTRECAAARIELLLARTELTTDNAVMIAYVATLKHARGEQSPLDADIDPNLALA